MKRLITLLLMATTLLTFTQKVMAMTPLLEGGAQVMTQCNMEEMMANSTNCVESISGMENCQNNCEMMNVVSVLYFIEHEQLLSFDVSQLQYTSLSTSPTHRFSERLYRPPFIN